MALNHEKAEVGELQSKLRNLLADRLQRDLVPAKVRALPKQSETAAPPACWKRISFIRHGEGHHNIAQQEWRSANKPGEPYTIDNDPTMKFRDATLTAVGEQQARDLQVRATSMSDVELIVVSPMRRATQTALIAFNGNITSGVPVVAHELCHEIGGKHTCDLRLSRQKLSDDYKMIDYSLLENEEDPLWEDGLTRESLESLADRASAFVRWILARPETRIVVASHSTFLMTLFNAVVELAEEDCSGCEGNPQADYEVRSWFGTGEMRTTLMSPRCPERRSSIL